MTAIDLRRSRWAAIGAAVAVTLGAGGLFTASAAVGSGERTVFVPVTPCRIMDTRPAPDTRGPRTSPLGASDTYTIDVFGAQGDCNVPADAVAVAMNITSLNATGDSFLTVFAAGAPRPTASSLNWRAGQAPTPNAVTADLATDGRLSFFNLAGTVDVIADVTGYYVDHHHDDRYYTKAEVYTKAEADAALATRVTKPSGSGQALIGPQSLIGDGGTTAAWFHDFALGELTVTTSTGCFAAPIELPDGAAVTSLSARVFDNAVGSANVTLWEDAYGGGGAATAMAQASSAGQSATEQTISDDTITNADVVTATNTYKVTVCLATNLRFYGATVTFTYP